MPSSVPKIPWGKRSRWPVTREQRSSPCRCQLVTSAGTMIKCDFPTKWPQFMNQIHVCLSTDNIETWTSVLLVFYTLVQYYEWVESICWMFRKRALVNISGTRRSTIVVRWTRWWWWFCPFFISVSCNYLLMMIPINQRWSKNKFWRSSMPTLRYRGRSSLVEFLFIDILAESEFPCLAHSNDGFVAGHVLYDPWETSSRTSRHARWRRPSWAPVVEMQEMGFTHSNSNVRETRITGQSSQRTVARKSGLC